MSLKLANIDATHRKMTTWNMTKLDQGVTGSLNTEVTAMIPKALFMELNWFQPLYCGFIWWEMHDISPINPNDKEMNEGGKTRLNSCG